ncbi:MAG: alpha-amylase family glycosyl hydrolase, partial [Aeromonas sp.]
TDGPRVHEFLAQLNQAVLKPLGAMTVGEMSSTTLAHCQRYAALTGHELSMVFNFHHLKVDYPQGEKWTPAAFDFLELKRIFSHWQTGMHGQAWSALFWCNHDQPRIVSRFGDDGEWREKSAKMLATALHGLQGTPYVYQGEELGMTNPSFTDIAAYRDVESLNYFAAQQAAGGSAAHALAVLAAKSRDNGRTPMPWSHAAHGGFTTGTPWLALANNYAEINAERALAAPDSVWHYYRQLIALRKTLLLLTLGDYLDLLPDHPQVWLYRRRYQGQTLLVACNFYARSVQIEIPAAAEVSAPQILLTNEIDALLLWSNQQTLLPYAACMWLEDTA